VDGHALDWKTRKPGDPSRQDIAVQRPMLESVHRKCYRPPPVRRVYIPKPGKTEKRPLGAPCVSVRALQRSVSDVLSAVYEQDFLPCSFGGRLGLGAHNALATLNEWIAGRRVSWVLEADLKNLLGRLDHGWLLRFVEHRVGDPRVIKLIRSWLKAGVLEEGVLHSSDEGTPQGGSSAWSSPGCEAKPIWCAMSTTLWCVSSIRPMPCAFRRRCANAWRDESGKRSSRDDLLPWLHALLHTESQEQLQGGLSHGEVALATKCGPSDGPDAANAPSAGG
jgi:hypothetical protein